MPGRDVDAAGTRCARGASTRRCRSQWCTDSIVHRALGGISQKAIHWQNRPTYQQVVEFPAHR
ncbi:hypothetical protein AB0N06_01915 [Streptomyces sp. NPDC051020]|uniref:hypothetical protein n=1 Tax=Streptomyces sp. NPDC051020 TaxID=3155409 RepID=UPI00343147BE